MTATPTARTTVDRSNQRHAPMLALIAIALIGAALLVLAMTQTPGPNVIWPRWLAMMTLAWWLPGALLIAHWRLSDVDAPTASVLALGVGLCWMMALTIAIHWWPGPIELWPMALIFAAGALLLAIGLLWRRPLPLQSTDRRTWGWLAALVLLAVILRLPGLAYHEFHYDEVLVLTRAKEAIRGEDDALARHTKGPGEIAIATVVYRTLGMANEATARLPFGLVSIGGVLALALLGRRLFQPPHFQRNSRASRLEMKFQAQSQSRLQADWRERRPPASQSALADLSYQPELAVQGGHLPEISPGLGSVGFWSGVLLAFNGFALGLSRIVQYQAAILLLMTLGVLAAWMFAVSGRSRWLALSGLLSAFGLVLHYEFGLVAPALLWLAWRGWSRAADKRPVINTLLATGVTGAGIVAAAYLPMILNPFVATTQSYLGTRMGALGSTFNLAFFVEMGTFYNSIYFFVGLLTLTIIGLFIGWRWSRQATLMLVLWFTPFLVLYFFIVQFPGTHFYLLMPSWSILAALPLAAITGGVRFEQKNGDAESHRDFVKRSMAWLAIIIWLLISGWYLHLIFFRQNPEYLINFQSERVPLYWAPYGEDAPEKPRFGFPIHEGWKTLGVLSEWKYLNGTYASNERSRHLRWYSGDFDRVPFEENPDFIFVATHLQEPDPAYSPDRLVDYAQVGEVRVRDEARIAIWARDPLPAPYVVYDSEQFGAIFDGVGPTFEEWPDPAPLVTEIPLDDRITLVQGGVDPAALAGDDTLHAYLVWRAEQQIDRDYKLFVHIADSAGRPVAQWDGLPGLNTARTSEWTAGGLFDDHVLITIPNETLPGSYSVLVGLYDGESGERLGGQAIEIGTVEIK